MKISELKKINLERLCQEQRVASGRLFCFKSPSKNSLLVVNLFC
jgi:hypothetical protein